MGHTLEIFVVGVTAIVNVVNVVNVVVVVIVVVVVVVADPLVFFRIENESKKMSTSGLGRKSYGLAVIAQERWIWG